MDDTTKAFHTHLQQNVQQARAVAEFAAENAKTQEQRLALFEKQFLGVTTVTPTTTETTTPPKTTGKKKVSKKAAVKKAPTQTNGKAARRQQGDRPPLKEAIASVMGDKIMNSLEVLEGLTARGWMPKSAKPRHYISFAMSTGKDFFEAVERGRYRVRDSAKKAAAPTKTAEEVDKSLQALGIGPTVADNPFTA